MALGTVTLCFLVALLTTCNAQSPTNWVTTWKTDFSYSKQQVVQDVFKNIYQQVPADKRCHALATAFTRSLGRSDAESVKCGCARVPHVSPNMKGLYYIPKEYKYIHLYVDKDDTNYILAAPAYWG